MTGFIHIENSYLDNLIGNLGNIQVATLTISAYSAMQNQEVRISNSAYTIISNFNSALTATIPIYCWGDYTVTVDKISKNITIDSNQINYDIQFYPPNVIYDHGYVDSAILTIKTLGSFQDNYILLQNQGTMTFRNLSIECAELYLESDYAKFTAVIWKNGHRTDCESTLKDGIYTILYNMSNSGGAVDYTSMSTAKITKIYATNG